MSVVQADGQNVRAIEVEEFQIAVAETLDVIVQPSEDRAFTLVAEAVDRSGMGRATLAPRPGMVAEVPPLRKRTILTMKDMGMDMSGMDHGDMSSDDMGGMMTEDEMADLESASGAEFDQMFLTMMIEHHEGAIEMAKTEQSEGEFPEAVDMAKEIETTQAEEIQTMQDLLKS